MTKTMRLIKEYALLSDNMWLFQKLEEAELEVSIKATRDIAKILES
jgi:hypothetical protein